MPQRGGKNSLTVRRGQGPPARVVPRHALRRRVAQFRYGYGFVTVNDGPALASAMARMVAGQ